MAKKVNYKVVSPDKLSTFLKRFSGVDSTLLVEISEGEIKAKTHTPDNVVVKFSKMGLNESFDLVSGEDAPIVFGLFNIDKFSGAFKHFGESSFNLIVEYDVLDGINVGTRIILRNSKLSIKFDCASYRLFKHITDDLFFNSISNVTETLMAKFDIDRTTFSKINSVCNVDTDFKLISFANNGNSISASGKSFDMEIKEDAEIKTELDITIYKSHLGFVDKEDTSVCVSDDRIVFSSDESETVTVIGKTED